MALAALLALASLAALASKDAPSLAPSSDGDDKAAQSAYGKLPLSFVLNKGQVDSRARFYAQAPGLGVFFGDDKVTLALQKNKKGHALELRFPGANTSATPEALDRRPGKVNYMTGSDRSKWQTDISTYGAIRYRSLWPGIDLTFKGTPGALKYELTVHPGADPNDIRLAYAGASGLSTTEAGALNVATPLGALTDQRPKTFQRTSTGTTAVQSSYALQGNQAYGFTLGRYDRSRPLVIDPGLAYSTYLGGSSDDFGYDISVDESGSAHIVGHTFSSNLPTTAGAYDSTYGGGRDTFIAKLNPAGTALVYSTFLGGGQANAIAVDANGSAYVTGEAGGGTFPTTPGAYDTSHNGSFDAFVTKLNGTGSALDYSTFLGGTFFDSGSGLAVDDSGSAYLTGATLSADLPTTAGAYDSTNVVGTQDAFVTKLNASGTGLAFSTYLGGSGPSTYDSGGELAVTATGEVYVAGSTSAANFPTTAGAADTSHGGGYDAFVARLNADASSLLSSTFLGGPLDDSSAAIALDPAGNVFTSGYTQNAGFPTTANAYDATYNGGYDGFVSSLDPALSTIGYSTFLGGGGDDGATGLATKRPNRVWISGRTSSTDFPSTPGSFDPSYNGGEDAYLAKLDVTTGGLAYSSFIGGGAAEAGDGVAVDNSNTPYLAGYTLSADFPTTPGAFDPTDNDSGRGDAFVAKLASLYDTPAASSPLQFSLVPHLRQTISSTQCQARGGTNSTHGPPLAFASCNPPRLLPGTVGRMGPQSTGTAQLAAVPGDLDPGNGDQADLAIDVAVSDIRDGSGLDYAPNAAAPDGSVVIRMRVSDTFSGASQDEPATLRDFDYSLPMDCTTSADPAVGSNCGTSTTMDAVTPGAILEGGSTILQTFGIRLYDAGADGTRGNSDDRWFAMGGIYIP